MMPPRITRNTSVRIHLDWSRLRSVLRGLRRLPAKVWVNTKSGKYWKPGSRYYGKTKQGEYMSEKEAVQKGYRPANGTGE